MEFIFFVFHIFFLGTLREEFQNINFSVKHLSKSPNKGRHNFSFFLMVEPLKGMHGLKIWKKGILGKVTFYEKPCIYFVFNICQFLWPIIIPIN